MVPLWYPMHRPICPDRPRSWTHRNRWTLRDTSAPESARLGAERSLVQIQSPRCSKTVRVAAVLRVNGNQGYPWPGTNGEQFFREVAVRGFTSAGSKCRPVRCRGCRDVAVGHRWRLAGGHSRAVDRLPAAAPGGRCRVLSPESNARVRSRYGTEALIVDVGRGLGLATQVVLREWRTLVGPLGLIADQDDPTRRSPRCAAFRLPSPRPDRRRR